MPWPANDSPFWPIARYAVTGTILVAFLAFNYANGWNAEKDLGTLIGVLGGAGAVDFAKLLFGRRDCHGEPTKP
jgi:hypothetical protein